MNKRLLKILFIFFFAFFVHPVFSAPNDKIALTIAPPLIKNNMQPGDTWVSYIKIVNNNISEVPVYAYTVDFKSDKNGKIEFITDSFTFSKSTSTKNEKRHFSLANWIEIDNGPIELKANESKEIPFVVRIPKNAEPGGHYAAILIGTKPGSEIKGSGLGVSSLLSSLVMINVGGDVIERADIREFSVEKIFYDEPKVKFKVRFQNTGNVHIQPKGEIKIYDFWGDEAGTILINHNSSFGNVLPNSTRTWNFEWQGEKKLSKMGRYRASLVLTYGEGAKETVYYTLYFWIVYWKELLMIVGAILLLIVLFVWSIKASVRRAILKAQKNIGITPELDASRKKIVKKEKRKNKQSKIVDLRK